MNLSIRLEIDRALAPSVRRASATGSCSLRRTFNFTLMDWLGCVGILTTGSYPVGVDLARLHAFYRYYWAVAGPGPLRLKDEIEEVDFHQKGLISDELGVGMGGLIASRVFGVKYFADTYPFVKRHPEVLATILRRRRKIPDFVGVNSAGDFFVLECKGSQSGNATVNEQIRSGRVQKGLRFGGVVPTRIVFATKFARESHPYNSLSRAVDPEPEIKFTTDDRILVQREHFLKIASAAGIRIKRDGLLSEKYEMNEDGCGPIKIGGSSGIGISFKIWASSAIGKVVEAAWQPHTYLITLGIQSGIHERIKHLEVPSSGVEVVQKSDFNKQEFSLVRDDGWMTEIRALD